MFSASSVYIYSHYNWCKKAVAILIFAIGDLPLPERNSGGSPVGNGKCQKGIYRSEVSWSSGLIKWGVGPGKVG
jgi:hypothetical protein